VSSKHSSSSGWNPLIADNATNSTQVALGWSASKIPLYRRFLSDSNCRSSGSLYDVLRPIATATRFWSCRKDIGLSPAPTCFRW
jgi:hypothetical protein